MSAPDSHTAKKPLICPKGYGICWGCETWCDMPQTRVAARRCWCDRTTPCDRIDCGLSEERDNR